MGTTSAGTHRRDVTRAALTFVTDFADQAVVLPTAIVVLVALALLGWRRAALSWALCVAATLGTTLALKLVVMACSVGNSAGLASPSGHAAGAACVYGGGFALLVQERRPATRIAALTALAVAVAVGVTRLALGVHSLADVCAGSAPGVIGAVSMRWLAGERPPGLRLARVAAVALVTIALLHGRRLDAEPRLRWAAVQFWPFTLCRT
jgi:membrane-associated phospholipid phosphatase